MKIKDNKYKWVKKNSSSFYRDSMEVYTLDFGAGIDVRLKGSGVTWYMKCTFLSTEENQFFQRTLSEAQEDSIKFVKEELKNRISLYKSALALI